MKLLRIQNSPWYWEGKKPSKSFLKKLAIALTEKISMIVKSPKDKEHLTQVLELAFDDFYYRYDTAKPFTIAMELVAKTQPLVLASFAIVWTPQDEAHKIVYPWDDVSNIEILFAFTFPDEAIRRINYLLPLLYSPVVVANESGLPYDYCIQNQTTDGTLVFAPFNQFSQESICEIKNVLNSFFKKANAEETKIHYMGDLKMRKNGQLSVVMDFGCSPKDIVIDCIFSFKKIADLKKITYQ